MTTTLVIASFLTALLAIVHSVLGEILILTPLHKKQSNDGVPAVFGSIKRTKSTLRFAWHVTSVLGFGIAFILYYYAGLTVFTSEHTLILKALSMTFFFCFIVSIVGSRGEHPAWLVFLILSVLTWLH